MRKAGADLWPNRCGFYLDEIFMTREMSERNVYPDLEAGT